MKGKVLPIGIIAIVLIAGAYFILTAQQKQPLYNYNTGTGQSKPSGQPAVFSKQPLTVQNENQVFTQTDTAIDTQLNQIDKDLKVWDETNASATSHDNASSINSL